MRETTSIVTSLETNVIRYTALILHMIRFNIGDSLIHVITEPGYNQYILSIFHETNNREMFSWLWHWIALANGWGFSPRYSSRITPIESS